MEEDIVEVVDQPVLFEPEKPRGRQRTNHSAPPPMNPPASSTADITKQLGNVAVADKNMLGLANLEITLASNSNDLTKLIEVETAILDWFKARSNDPKYLLPSVVFNEHIQWLRSKSEEFHHTFMLKEWNKRLHELTPNKKMEFINANILKKMITNFSEEESKLQPITLRSNPQKQLEDLLGFLFFLKNKDSRKLSQNDFDLLCDLASINGPSKDTIQLLITNYLIQYIASNVGKLYDARKKPQLENTGTQRYIIFIHKMTNLFSKLYNLEAPISNIQNDLVHSKLVLQQLLGMLIFASDQKHERHVDQPITSKPDSDFRDYLEEKWVAPLFTYIKIAGLADEITQKNSLTLFTKEWKKSYFPFKLRLEDKLEKYGFEKDPYTDTKAMISKVNIENYSTIPAKINKEIAQTMIAAFIAAIESKPEYLINKSQKAYQAMVSLCQLIANAKKGKHLAKQVQLKTASKFSETLMHLLERFDEKVTIPDNYEEYSECVKMLEDLKGSTASTTAAPKPK